MKKKYILVILLFLILVSASILFFPKVKDFINSFKKDTPKQQSNEPVKVLVPLIQNPELPNGRVGEEYEAKVTAYIIGGNSRIVIDIERLPEGLEIIGCANAENIQELEAPNTLTTCTVSGKPLQAGTFPILIIAIEGNNTAQSTVPTDLIILEN